MTQPLQSHVPLWRRAHLLAWAACAVVLAFVLVALVKQFRQVPWAQVHFHPLPATGAVLCVFAVSVIQLIARWTLLAAYGYRLPARMMLPIAWLPQLGKYVPGGVASVGGAVYLLRRVGVPGAVGLSVAVLIDAMAVVAGLIVSTPLLLWAPIRARIPFGWLVCAILTIVGLVLLHPRVFVGSLNVLLRRINRQPITQVPPLRRYVWPLIASFAQWFFAGLGLWLMTTAVTDTPPAMLPLFIAIAALAMTISYLMVFAPAGIGVQEGLYLLTLGPLVGPQAAIVVVAMRIVQTLVELLLAGVGVAMIRSSSAGDET